MILSPFIPLTPSFMWSINPEDREIDIDRTESGMRAACCEQQAQDYGCIFWRACDGGGRLVPFKTRLEEDEIGLHMPPFF